MRVDSGVRARVRGVGWNVWNQANLIPRRSSKECKGVGMSSQVKGRLASALICLTLSASVNFAGWIWISAFLKIEAMRVPYVLLLSVFLSVAFYALSRGERVRGISRSLVFGLIAGFVFGTVAITLSNLAIDGGHRLLLKSFERFGAKALVADLWPSLLLGSWLVGAIAFCGASAYLRRAFPARRVSHREQ